MKILGLVLALAILATGACVADSKTINVYTGWNLLALPIAPYDSTPANIFVNTFAQYPPPAGPRGALSTTVLGNGVSYDPLNPTPFGGILLGQGYWVRPKTAATTETYSGFPDGLSSDGTPANQVDMWISLPGNATGTGGAWHMIGQPFDHDTIVSDAGGVLNTDPADGAPVIQFTNGIDVKSWPDAYAAGWVDNKAAGYDTVLPGHFGGFVVSFNPVIRLDNMFRARHGYQIFTKVPNLAMIIRAHGVM